MSVQAIGSPSTAALQTVQKTSQEPQGTSGQQVKKEAAIIIANKHREILKPGKSAQPKPHKMSWQPWLANLQPHNQPRAPHQAE
jgi:hypothetical protein